MSSATPNRPFFAKSIRTFAVLVVLFWAALAACMVLFAPKIENVTQDNTGPLVPLDAPSSKAMLRIGEVFKESDSTTIAMLVLEADHQLGEADHQYYDGLVRQLEQDHKHVQYVMNLWGQPVTAAGNQSNDGKAAFTLVRLAGNTGSALANESIRAVRDTVARTRPTHGLTVYVTGPGPLSSDALHSGNESMGKLVRTTVIIITALLLIVYRSITTVLLPLLTVALELLSGRGAVSLLVSAHLIGISTFATNMVVSLILGAGTDYCIFLLGRYHEARQQGQDRETAYYTAVRGVSHVIVGSGFAIAGATFCLSFTRLNYFKTMGVPCAVAMVITVAAALTLGPAFLTLGSKINLLDAKKKINTRRWRRIGTSVVRWPAPILAVSCAVVLIGSLTLPSYREHYDDRDAMPADTPANLGYQAADRHFPASRLSSDMLLVESDHDLRNSTDMLALDRVNKNIFRIHGISMVQSITRPLGVPLEHTSIPFTLGYMGSKIGENIRFMNDRIADMGMMSDVMGKMIVTLQHMQELMRQMATASQMSHDTATDLSSVTGEMRENAGYLDDFLRPFRAYFYWEQNCFDIPACWAIRSAFSMLDDVDKIADDTAKNVESTGITASTTPQMVQQLGDMITNLVSMRTLMLTMQSSMKAFTPQLDQLSGNMRDLGQNFENAKNDDFFYLPPDAFANPDFGVDLRYFVSPDGKAARFLVYHEGKALSPAGIAQDETVLDTARDTLKGTSLAGSKVYLGGAVATYWDIRDGAKVDLIIAATASFALIFLIMLLLTRSLAAALVILGTVAFSFSGAFGLSVLVWQHIIGKELNWLVLPLSFIILVAVGSDYNLLLISRLKEEIGAGLKTGIIRAVGSTGGVVTTAGLVFAFTMLAMLSSDLLTVGQVGSTICIGLLLDTLIVRSFIVPAIARLLGVWFWWPQKVRSRPVSALR